MFIGFVLLPRYSTLRAHAHAAAVPSHKRGMRRDVVEVLFISNGDATRQGSRRDETASLRSPSAAARTGNAVCENVDVSAENDWLGNGETVMSRNNSRAYEHIRVF